MAITEFFSKLDKCLPYTCQNKINDYYLIVNICFSFVRCALQYKKKFSYTFDIMTIDQYRFFKGNLKFHIMIVFYLYKRFLCELKLLHAIFITFSDPLCCYIVFYFYKALA